MQINIKHADKISDNKDVFLNEHKGRLCQNEVERILKALNIILPELSEILCVVLTDVLSVEEPTAGRL